MPHPKACYSIERPRGWFERGSKMRKTIFAAMTAALICGAGRAAVTYSFYDAFDYRSFTLTTDDYISSDRTFTSFTTKSASLSSVTFLPDCPGSFPSKNCDQISTTFDSGISQTAFFYFSDNALKTNGSYNSSYGSNFRLTVAGAPSPAALPEPASWAMMIAGFGAIGCAMRRRKIPVRFA